MDLFFGFFILTGQMFFFLFIFLHIFKALFYFSYRIKKVWASGILIFLLLIASAFIGYVLPWTEMRFWACVVITNLVRVIPYIGRRLILWIWGGFSVNNSTLGLFFCSTFYSSFNYFSFNNSTFSTTSWNRKNLFFILYFWYG